MNTNEYWLSFNINIGGHGLCRRNVISSELCVELLLRFDHSAMIQGHSGESLCYKF